MALLSKSDLLSITQALEVRGAPAVDISAIVRLDAPPQKPSDLFWCKDANVDLLTNLSAGTVLCSAETAAAAKNQMLTYVVVTKPKLAFLRALRAIDTQSKTLEVASTAKIHESVKIGAAPAISHYVVIEHGCIIGDHVEIGPHTVIRRNTVIGNNVVIGAHNTIGGVGFGYEKDEEGEYQLVPHLGNVVIEDGVEIGNNSTIDRAPLGSTFIGKNSKIDNLVHVGHGCRVESNSLLIAHCMLGGSAVIGSGAWIAPCAAISNGITIGPGAVVGMGAVVIAPVAPCEVVVGNPARAMRKASEPGKPSL